MQSINKSVLAALASASHAALVAEVDFQTGGVTFLGANEGPTPMKRIALALALAALSLMGSAAVANAATMTVSPTGEVVFADLPTDANPAGPIGLTVRSASGILNAAGGVNIGDIFDVTQAPYALAWSKFSGFGSGPWNAGQIVNVAGLTVPQLESDLTFVTHGAFGTIVVGDVIVEVPEPATIALGGLAMVGVVAVARRRPVA